VGPDSGDSSGVSLVEVLVAIVLITLMLVPAIDALQTGILGGAVQTARAVGHYHVMAKLEETLAQPFGSLDGAATAAGSPSVPTTYSDSAGSPQRRLVFLSRWDGDNADGDDDPLTGVEADLLWVRVEIEATNQALETLTRP
jgi:hypothetical protein